MADRFRNKYRIPSARLQTWDYASAAAYFITICTHCREHYFGEIENHKMKLTPVGVIADLIWYENINHAKNIETGEFVVMPNHIHGILILNGMDGENENDHSSIVVETRHALSLRSNQPNKSNESNQPSQIKPPSIGTNRFQNQGKNTVSSIIGGYKSAVTKHANRLGFNFAWQPRFYDHIIRDEQSFARIQHYIANNPFNWKEDKFYN